MGASLQNPHNKELVCKIFLEKELGEILGRCRRFYGSTGSCRLFFSLDSIVRAEREKIGKAAEVGS
jgi:hypothetical protein